jgi:hypothetical protein
MKDQNDAPESRQYLQGTQSRGTILFRRVAVGSALVLALLAALGLGWFLRGGSAPSPPPAPPAVSDRFEGTLLPVVRRGVYPPYDARVVRFEVEPGSVVGERQRLVLVHCPELQDRVLEVRAEVGQVEQRINTLELGAQVAGLPLEERNHILTELARARAKREVGVRLGDEMFSGVEADKTKPGHFWLKSPPFDGHFADRGLEWTVLEQDYRGASLDWMCRRSEPLLRLGAFNGPWEIKLEIPEKLIGHVRTAFGPERLTAIDVEVALPDEPGRTYKGKLRRDRIAGEARPAQEDENRSDPVVAAYVEIYGPDIPEAERIPPELLGAVRTVEVRIPSGR